MSYPNHTQPRRSAPLIQRPSAAAPPPPPRAAAPASSLSTFIQGALGGMGYAHAHPGYYGAPAPGAHGGAAPGLHQLGQPHPGHSAPAPYAGYAGYGQHGGAPYGYGPPPPQANYAHQQQHPAAYPPPFYPPTHQQHYAQPPPSAYPYPQRFSSAAPPPPRPNHAQTTDDGYTLSSTYSGPPPASSSSSAVPQSRAARNAPAPRQPKAPREPAAPQTVACAQPGCTFTGSRKVVREHEEDRHLIFAPGREPKPWDGTLKPKEGAVIEGTGLALDTPEAVARWIEERKKRWPSRKVVDEKERARAERVAAGLEAPPRERGGRGCGRGRGQADTGGRGRGGGRGGFVGDRGWGAQQEAEGAPPAKRARVEDGPQEGAPAFGRPASSIGSGSDGASTDNSDDDDDDGPPEETGIKGVPADLPSEPAEADDVEVDGASEETSATNAGADEVAPQKRFQVVCRHWRRGNCGLGDACPYLHELPANALPPPPPKRKRPAPPPAPHNPFARPSGYSDAFSLLEERDYRHLVSDVLQVVEFLGANDWLAGVEIRRGQVEEESGIEVLPEAEGDGDALQGGKEVGIEEVDDQVVASELAHAHAAAVAVGAEPSQPAVAPLAPPASAVASVMTPAAAASVPIQMGGLGALVADYGSDTDDEAEEESVAAALTGRA